MKNLLLGLFSILSAFFLFKGFDKMLNYSNSESILREKVNVYVGGDAYNYIINSNLSTSYFVLATFFGLAAIGIWTIMTIENEKSSKLD